MQNLLKTDAIYKQGVFIPYSKINLNEGQVVSIEIKKRSKQKNVSLRGIWNGIKIKDEDIEKVKKVWDKGLNKKALG